MERVKQFHNALMDAFTPAELDRLLQFEFGRRLDDFTGDRTSKPEMFLDVINAAVGGGWLLELANRAFLERSGNEKIRSFYADHVQSVFRDGHPQSHRHVSPNRDPYYMPPLASDNDLPGRLMALELVVRGADGFNGALSKIRHLETRLNIVIGVLIFQSVGLIAVLALILRWHT